jgi:hypothetical protein
MIILSAIRDFGQYHKDNCGPNFGCTFYGWLKGDKEHGPQYAGPGYSTLGYGLYLSQTPKEAMEAALRIAIRNNWSLLRLDVQGGADHRQYGYSCTDIFVSENYSKYMTYSRKPPLPYDEVRFGKVTV